MNTIIVFIFIGFAISSGIKITEQGVLIYHASRGQTAVLPCGLDKVILDGPNAFVAWTKNNGHIFHKYPDVKYKRQQVLEHNFTRDCSANCPDNTALLIENVSLDDGGTYRCRVHFQNSRLIRNTIMELVIVDSPGQPRIYNESGLEVIGDVAPVTVGSNVTLTYNVPKDSDPGEATRTVILLVVLFCIILLIVKYLCVDKHAGPTGEMEDVTGAIPMQNMEEQSRANVAANVAANEAVASVRFIDAQSPERSRVLI